MNPAHLHLLLNHFPTVAFSLGLGLFAVSLFAKSDELKRASLVVLFLTAAVSIATYVTGADAQDALKEIPEVSPAAIAAHESAALVAFIFMQVTGLFAWLALWTWRRVSRWTNSYMAAVMIFGVVAFGLMARAANIGGEIRHSEIAAATTPDAQNEGDTKPTLARAWSMYVEAHSWVWPTAETIHFIGLCLLFAVVLTVDLRIIGIGKKQLSFPALYQLLPWGMAGFLLNLITGMMFFVATPMQYTGWLFLLKMILVVLGAVNVLYFMVIDEPWRIGEGDDASLRSKIVAASAIAIWIGVLCCGHLLPFYGNSF